MKFQWNRYKTLSIVYLGRETLAWSERETNKYFTAIERRKIGIDDDFIFRQRKTPLAIGIFLIFFSFLISRLTHSRMYKYIFVLLLLLLCLYGTSKLTRGNFSQYFFEGGFGSQFEEMRKNWNLFMDGSRSFAFYLDLCRRSRFTRIFTINTHWIHDSNYSLLWEVH
jgi:hypothetical protein